MTNAVREAQRLGQSIWYDNIRRGFIKSGELQRLIELGVSGLTSNPTIFEKAIAGSTDYDEALLEIPASVDSVGEIFEQLAIEDIGAAADLLRPIYERTGGADGYASLEVNPRLAHDAENTIGEARRLFDALGRPNVMVKVPATPEGFPAIRRLVGEGINVNVTLVFSLDSYRNAADAYINGLQDLQRSGGDVSKVASVASFFVSRVDTAVDVLLEERIRDGDPVAKALMGKAAIANARLAYQEFEDIFASERFAALREKGAMVQRPLWASTGTKNPAYSDVLYVEMLIGPDTVNTMPAATLNAFMEHGRAESTIKRDVSDARWAMDALAEAGISIEGVTDKLLTDGVAAFADSFEKLLANIDEKRARLLARAHAHPGVSLGKHLPDVEATVADLQRRDVMGRIWRKDHTVWKPDPGEITNRLEWLTVSDAVSEEVSSLENFATEVRESDFRHVVLLGMGGSSLGPEVLRQTFGSAPGYPELIVLDSTVPGWVRAVTEGVDPGRTLFLVSSKSGGTIEPNSLYAHFRQLVEQATGKDKAGRNFVAVTDPGTSLGKLAREHEFRRTFVNPPDIGGRYSVLSYFGLVPAALMGTDIEELLYRADCMREGCAPFVPAHDNPGAWLGAAMGTLALRGRDKLTIVTSPSIGSFGLWAEQLLAESTGKEGKGVVPVAGESLVATNSYGDDRLFIYLRLEGDDNSDIDAVIDAIESSGQPVIRLALRDKHDLGGEFFRWELATAVAGSVLDIHPFDQPNVQAAKDMTESVLQQFDSFGEFPPVDAAVSVSELLSVVRPGNYLALMAYLQQTPEVDRALSGLRREVAERYGIATTSGYGPRFLHSTGQLHKGGPASGLFLQLTTEHGKDLAIPGQPYTFGVLADAQALGDLHALQALGRRVARVHLGPDHADGIDELAAELAK